MSERDVEQEQLAEAVAGDQAAATCLLLRRLRRLRAYLLQQIPSTLRANVDADDILQGEMGSEKAPG